MSSQQVYDKLIKLYDEGVSKSDTKLLNDFLSDETYRLLKSDKAYYLQILQLRSGAFTLFGDLKSAGQQYAEGYDLCVDSSKWIYCYNWALIYLIELNLNRGDDKLKESFTEAIKILDKALLILPHDKNASYYKLAINNIKAFMYMCTGDIAKAKTSMYDNIFVPIPISDYNDKEALQFLFSHLTKGISIAIELRDEKLLLNILNVIAVDDELMMGDSSLFNKFYSVLVATFDMRPEFIMEFNNLFRIKDKLNKYSPIFTEFLALVGNQKTEELETFFLKFNKSTNE